MEVLLLTERQVCAHLNISRSTLRRLMAQGTIRPVHIGRAIRFPLGELERFVSELQSGEDYRE